MQKTIHWTAISGSWRYHFPQLERDVRREVGAILDSHGGITTGGALGVDFMATSLALERKATSQLKIFLPTALESYIKHYQQRASEGVITPQQANQLEEQLTTVRQLSPDCLIEDPTETVVNRASYFKRNSKIVEAADCLIAFQVNKSSGTQDTINKARALSLPVQVFEYTVKEELNKVMLVEQIPVDLRYKKENGLWVLDIDSIAIPFSVAERSIVYLPPQQIGGNHSHPRKEAFVAIGKELLMIWREAGQTHQLAMNPDGQLLLTIVSSNVEHAVINQSKVEFAVLFELADQLQNGVKHSEVVT